MMTQDAYQVITDDGTDSGNYGGGSMQTVLLSQGPAGLNTAPPNNPNTLNPPPPQIINQYGTGYPVPGGQVTQPPPSGTVPNMVTLQNTAPAPSPANPGDVPAASAATTGYSWLWLVAAAGGIYLLANNDRRRAGVGSKGNSTAPLLLVGGIAALYLLSNSKHAPVTPTPVQTTLPVSGGGGGGTILMPLNANA